MPVVYHSNAPEYFRYIATIYNKDEIKSNPQLCHLIEDPYLKDDMELALAFNDAENGGYEEKKTFVEFLLANGPELDAGTIMYYRNIILNDPEYSFIANAEFSNIETIDTAREEKYDKHTSKDDCFRNPCNYLGPFSVSMMKVGDSGNFMNINNLFSAAAFKRISKKEEEEKNGKGTSKIKDEELAISDVFCDTCVNLWNRLIPNIQANWSALTNCVKQQYDDFAEHLGSKNVKSTDIPGDPSAVQRAEALTPLVQFHLHQRLGDCSRLFDYMRNLNLYDPVKNVQPAVTEVGNKTLAGAPSPGTVTTDADTVGTKENTNPKKSPKAKAAEEKAKESSNEWTNLDMSQSATLSGRIADAPGKLSTNDLTMGADYEYGSGVGEIEYIDDKWAAETKKFEQNMASYAEYLKNH